MFEKMIGVSPPPTGAAQDTKRAEERSLRDAIKGDHKRDFEKALQEKLDQKRHDLAEQRKAEKRAEDRKAERDREEKLRAEKNEKSSGGTKKKVTEKDDDKMVSNVMASKESEVETPDQAKKDPAEIEDGVQKTDGKQTAQQKLEAMLEKMLQGAHSAVDGAVAKRLKEDQQQKAMPNAEAGAEAKAKAQADVQAGLQTDVEAELKAASDFKADPKLQNAKQELAEKMKAFDGADKNASSDKAHSLEQSILERLQKEGMLKADAGSSQQNQTGTESGHKGSENAMDLKSDLQQQAQNQLHHAAGQSHVDFKAHMNGTSAANPGAQTPQQLEDHRDANIHEIMNQAQYLVKKGGGEVTVKMTPEGMGEVQLKVLLQNGKLNIEMQTQDKSVKKLIEESLTELKSGLAAHRLSLEHVKIDSVNATNTDNNAQMQSNLNQHNGGENRGREFWNGFQGNMNNPSSRQRSSYSDNGAPARANLTSLSAAAAPAPQSVRTYGGTKGATINRVA
jgi:flagellar hook-length control protein FliK